MYFLDRSLIIIFVYSKINVPVGRGRVHQFIILHQSQLGSNNSHGTEIHQSRQKSRNVRTGETEKIYSNQKT